MTGSWKSVPIRLPCMMLRRRTRYIRPWRGRQALCGRRRRRRNGGKGDVHEDEGHAAAECEEDIEGCKGGEEHARIQGLECEDNGVESGESKAERGEEVVHLQE